MIFVTYRNNDLFQTHVPRLLEGLSVTSQFVIPAGTELDTVKDEYVAAVERAVSNGARIMLSDETCNEWQYKGYVGHEPKFRSTSVNLNELFHTQVEDWLGSKTLAQNSVWFAQQLVGTRLVKQILVVTDSICDHRLVGSGGPGRRSNLEMAEWLGEQLAGHFLDAKVSVVDSLADALKWAEDPTALLVMDRHCGIKPLIPDYWYSLSGWKSPALMFMLPFENTTHHLMGREGFDFSFDYDQMRKKIPSS